MKTGFLIGFSVAGWLLLAARLHPAGKITLAPEGNTVTVALHLPPLDGKIILNAPEVVNDDTRRLVYTDTNLKSVRWEMEKHGALHSEWSHEGLAAYRMTLTPETDGVRIDWTLTNLSQERWKDIGGNIDMQSYRMPTFFDRDGERIFLRANGHWVSARDSWVERGSNWFLPPGREPLSIMQPLIKDHSWQLSQFHPDEAILALQSSEGGWVLAQAWKQSQYFIVNVRDHYQCSETPPLLGDIGPGQTVHARGKVYLFQGTLDELESKYQADLKAQRIYLHGPK